MTGPEARGKDLDQVHLALISGAKKTLKDLELSATVCTWGIPISYLILGAIGLLAGLSLAINPIFYSSLIITLIGVLLLVRESISSCRSCCTEDISMARKRLSLLSEDGTIKRDSEDGVSDTLVKIVIDSERWVDATEQHVRAVFFWPLVAVLVIAIELFGTNEQDSTIVAGVLLAYLLSVYAVVEIWTRRKLHRWRSKVRELMRLEENILGD
jgi:uncharacterized membrane protein HdeD (DUF308 family)